MTAPEHQKDGEVVPAPAERREGEDSCRISPAGEEPEGGIPAFGDLDRLDRLALASLLFLVVAAVAIAFFSPDEAGVTGSRGGGARQKVMVVSPELDNKLAVAANLLNGGDPGRAGELLDALIAEFPYEGGPHMLKGDLLLRRQQPVAAMLEYRQGVDLNPDYLDKKLPALFQGKKVKSNLEEARREIEAGLARTPGDPTLRRQREVYYYMLRKLAGSCG